MGFWLVSVDRLVFEYQLTLGAGYVAVTGSHPARWQAFHIWHVGSRQLRYPQFHFYKLILHLLLSCSNRLVSTTYFASFFIFLDFNMMNLKSFDCLPIACANLCYSRSYALDSNKKCQTVSVASILKFSRHASHLGFSHFLILWRNLLTGTYLIRICIIRLTCFLVSLSLALLKFKKGNWLSTRENLSWLEFLHHVFHCALSSLWNSCFNADAFFSRGWRSRWRRVSVVLVFPIAASFTSPSAILLPWMSLCAEIHEIWIGTIPSALCLFCLLDLDVSSIMVRNSLNINWDNLARGFAAMRITPWLSE